MNYTILADFLWYSGHILYGISVFFSQSNYVMAVSMVCIGQFITIISRPIGRLQQNVREPNEENNKKLENIEMV